MSNASEMAFMDMISADPRTWPQLFVSSSMSSLERTNLSDFCSLNFAWHLPRENQNNLKCYHEEALLFEPDELQEFQEGVGDEDENVNEKVAGREEDEGWAVPEQRRRQMLEELWNVCK